MSKMDKFLYRLFVTFCVIVGCGLIALAYYLDHLRFCA